MKFERLGDHTKFLSGFAFKSEFFNTDGHGLPVVRIRDVVAGRSETYYSGDFDQRYVVRRGDYLIGMDGEFNLAKWRSDDALLNQRVCKIDETSADLDQYYLARFLPSALKKIEDETPFVTVKHLSVKTLNEIRIPLPPLAEQKRIAGILDAAEALRAKRREALSQLDTLLQATFLDLFGDPVTNPKGWAVRSFEECCEAIFKGAFDLKAECYRREGIPFIRIADIQNRTISLTDAVYIDEKTHEHYKRSELTPGDIVFSKVGTIDRIAAIPNSISRCNCSQNNVGARLNRKLLKVEFALALLTTPSVLDRIRAGSKKAVQDKLVLAELRKLPVILPPIEEQGYFAKIVESVGRHNAWFRAHLAELDMLFASLQSRAFRGEL